jgi:hypothetical protein
MDLLLFSYLLLYLFILIFPSFLMLPMTLVCSSFSSFWKCKINLLVWDCFHWNVSFIAIHFSLRTVCIQKLWQVVFSFSFVSQPFLTCLVFDPLVVQGHTSQCKYICECASFPCAIDFSPHSILVTEGTLYFFSISKLLEFVHALACGFSWGRLFPCALREVSALLLLEEVLCVLGPPGPECGWNPLPLLLSRCFVHDWKQVLQSPFHLSVLLGLLHVFGGFHICCMYVSNFYVLLIIGVWPS